MPSSPLKRLSNSLLLADEKAFIGLKTIEGYKPPNPEFSLEAVTEAYNTYRRLREAEIVANQAQAAARDAAVLSEHAFHRLMNGSKDQVTAIYGNDSDQVAALGLKKKSEKKTGGARTKAATSQ